MDKNVTEQSRFLPVILLCLLGCASIFFGRLFILPSISSEFSYPAPKKNETMPFLLEFPAATKSVQFQLFFNKGLLPIDALWLRADDVMTRIGGSDNSTLSVVQSDGVLNKYSYPVGGEYIFPEPLRQSINEVTVLMNNLGGTGNFQVVPAPSGAAYKLLFGLFLAFSAGIYWFYRSQTDGTFFIFVAGIAIRFWYLAYTPPWLRQYDAIGHLGYIGQIFSHGALPEVSAGWETHQPPLYYLLGASFLKLLHLFGRSILNGEQDLQIVSWCLELTALTFVLCYMQQFKSQSKVLYYVVVGAVVLFPGWILLSPRISNDPLFHLLMIVSLISFVTWWKTNAERQWWVALSFACLATLTKLTGVVFLAVYGVAFLFKLFRRQIRFHPLIFRSILLVTGLLGLFIYQRLINPEKVVLAGSYRLTNELIVPSGWTEFLTFRPSILLRNPFANPWGIDDLRKNFLEFLYRSVYFGEFNFGIEVKSIATCVEVTGLLVLIATAVLCFRRQAAESWFAVTIFCIWVLAAAYYRYAAKYSCTQDFRYITPAFLLFTVCVLTCRSPRILTPLVTLSACSMLVFWGLWLSNPTIIIPH